MWTAVERFRPQVLAAVQGNGSLYLFGGHPTAYKLFLVFMTVLCAVLLWVLVRRLGGSEWLAAGVLALAGASIQFRAYHDPVLGYFGTTQSALALVLASLLVFQRALASGRRRDHLLATVLFLAACLLHEYVYPVAAAHLVMALFERRGMHAWRAAAGPLAVGAALSAVGFFGRVTGVAASVIGGYEVSGSPGGTIRSVFTQLLPPVPGSSRLFENNGFLFYPSGSSPTAPELFAAGWRGLAVCAVLLLIARRPPPGSALLARLAALGATLWITPILLVAAAPKYHGELTPGKGYLPTLFQAAGFGLAALAAALALLRLAAGRSRAAYVTAAVGVAVLGGYATGVSGFNNIRVATTDNLFRESRDLLEAGAERGALDALPRGATLLFSGRDTAWPIGDWRSSDAVEAVLLERTGKVFDGRINVEETALGCPPDADTDNAVPADCEPFAADVAWVRFRPRPGGGSVLAAALPPGTRSPQRARRAPVAVVRAYNSADDPPRLVGVTAAGAQWSSDAVQWRTVTDADGWGIYEADLGGDGPTAESLDDANAKVDMLALPTPEDRVRIYGARRLLP
jgi:hypothetical protein